MAYDGKTPQGNAVNANLYNQYQQYVIAQQSNGMPAQTYDQWIQQQSQQPQNTPNKFF